MGFDREQLALQRRLKRLKNNSLTIDLKTAIDLSELSSAIVYKLAREEYENNLRTDARMRLDHALQTIEWLVSVVMKVKKEEVFSRVYPDLVRPKRRKPRKKPDA